MALMVSMREIESCDIHSCVEHVHQLLLGGATWAKSADDLGLPLRHISGVQDLFQLDPGSFLLVLENFHAGNKYYFTFPSNLIR